jgi:hypothetical protein
MTSINMKWSMETKKEEAKGSEKGTEFEETRLANQEFLNSFEELHSSQDAKDYCIVDVRKGKLSLISSKLDFDGYETDKRFGCILGRKGTSLEITD